VSVERKKWYTQCKVIYCRAYVHVIVLWQKPRKEHLLKEEYEAATAKPHSFNFNCLLLPSHWKLMILCSIDTSDERHVRCQTPTWYQHMWISSIIKFLPVSMCMCQYRIRCLCQCFIADNMDPFERINYKNQRSIFKY
jgi:hypothetical protein